MERAAPTLSARLGSARLAISAHGHPDSASCGLSISTPPSDGPNNKKPEIPHRLFHSPPVPPPSPDGLHLLPCRRMPRIHWGGSGQWHVVASPSSLQRHPHPPLRRRGSIEEAADGDAWWLPCPPSVCSSVIY